MRFYTFSLQDNVLDKVRRPSEVERRTSEDLAEDDDIKGKNVVENEGN